MTNAQEPLEPQGFEAPQKSQRSKKPQTPQKSQKSPKSQTPQASPFRSGFVALVGRPNVGKSTLINACLGQKLAITSPTAQTTRRRLRAVITTDTSQIILVDTPGLHKPQDMLGAKLNQSALSALHDADVAALLIDATQPIGRGDMWVAEHVMKSDVPYKLLVFTKADISNPDQLAQQQKAVQALGDFDQTLVVSAQEQFNVEGFLSLLAHALPVGPRWFLPDMDSDATDDMLVSEFVREKLMRSLHDELPHAVGVICDELHVVSENHASIRARILVERESQKAIVIGKGGSMIKRIGQQARHDIERLWGCSVYLDLLVEVAPHWRRDEQTISRLGYGDSPDDEA